MSSLQSQLDKMIQRLNLKLVNEFKRIQIDASNKLRKKIWENVYMRYDPKVYDNTYMLINSITLTPIKITPNGLVEFSIYLDGDKMHHTSVVSGNQYWEGKKINVSYLVNDGHYHRNKNTPWFHQYPEAGFIEKSIKEIENEIRTRVKDVLSVEVKRIGKY